MKTLIFVIAVVCFLSSCGSVENNIVSCPGVIQDYLYEINTGTTDTNFLLNAANECGLAAIKFEKLLNGINNDSTNYYFRCYFDAQQCFNKAIYLYDSLMSNL